MPHSAVTAGSPKARFHRAAPLPLAFAVVLGTASLSLTPTALRLTHQLLTGTLDIPGALLLALAVFLASATLCSLADAKSRLHEAERMVRTLTRFGPRGRVLRPRAASRCQRDAVRHAAELTGHGKAVAAYFHELGYRPHHILPDVVFSRPATLFSLAFLRVTFIPAKR